MRRRAKTLSEKELAQRPPRRERERDRGGGNEGGGDGGSGENAADGRTDADGRGRCQVKVGKEGARSMNALYVIPFAAAIGNGSKGRKEGRKEVDQ